MTDTIFITGSSGYLGNILAQHFAKTGWQVAGYDVVANPAQKGLNNFTFVQADILDRETLKAALVRSQPSHVLHLAWSDTAHNKRKEHRVDIEGSKNVIDLACELPCLKQLMFFSSTRVYGAHSNHLLWYAEEDLPEPLDDTYGQDKSTVENYCVQKGDSRIVVLRMCPVVGPHTKSGLVRRFAKKSMVFVLDGENTALQCLHEDDFLALIEAVSADLLMHGIYTVAPDTFTHVEDLAEHFQITTMAIPSSFLRFLLSIFWRLHFTKYPPRSVRLMTYGIVALPKKIQERFHYSFKYSSKDAFIHAVEQYVNQ